MRSIRGGELCVLCLRKFCTNAAAMEVLHLHGASFRAKASGAMRRRPATVGWLSRAAEVLGERLGGVDTSSTSISRAPRSAHGGPGARSEGSDRSVISLWVRSTPPDEARSAVAVARGKSGPQGRRGTQGG